MIKSNGKVRIFQVIISIIIAESKYSYHDSIFIDNNGIGLTRY